ncbi:MAG: hypothetical protein CK538_07465 [Opitutia bacterium]|nr:MAG: hypothetical protein CK538_07465 [Opitutae bacterium]
MEDRLVVGGGRSSAAGEHDENGADSLPAVAAGAVANSVVLAIQAAVQGTVQGTAATNLAQA